MLHFLIDEHPAGWSTIIRCDFTLAPGSVSRWSTPCTVCGLESWKHYRQYYAAHGMGNFIAALDPGIVMVLGHSYAEKEKITGPQCYCHGGSRDEAALIDESTAFGLDWAYVFDEPAELMNIYSCEGEGDIPEWRLIASIDLDGKEPDWDELNRGIPDTNQKPAQADTALEGPAYVN